MKRHWRVGTWSMGIALLAMGVLLLISRFDGSQWLDLSLFWWPVILVFLGLEILIYLWISPEENPVLRYDIFSVLLLSLLGAGYTTIAVLNSTGLLEEVRSTVGSREVRIEAEPLQLPLGSEVSRIVLQGGGFWNGRLLLDSADSNINEVRAFGTCRYNIGKMEADPKALPLVMTNQVGGTLYVEPQRPPAFQHLRGNYIPSCTLTIVLPADKQVDIAPDIGVSMVAGAKVPSNWRFVDYAELKDRISQPTSR